MCSSTHTISVCVCTADRPEVLHRCLESIQNGRVLPFEILVSDDSRSPAGTQLVCSSFPSVRYVRGPKQGLCANRNAAIRACLGNYISLVDDDAVLSPEFLQLASDLAPRMSPKTILTGDVLEDGHLLTLPTNPTFWGHFGRIPYGRLENVHLNCNLFPRSAFQIAEFDESIVYGYEDMDLCAQLLLAGYQIEYHQELVNQHIQPPKDDNALSVRRRQADQARYYTSLKRYLCWQRKPLKAFTFMLLAPLHQSLYHLKHGHVEHIPACFSDMRQALKQVRAGTRGMQSDLTLTA